MPEVPLHLPGGGRARAVLSGGPLRQVQVCVDGIAVGKCALPHLLHYRITTICETCGQLMEGASVHYHSIHYRCDVTSIAMNGVSSLTLSPPHSRSCQRCLVGNRSCEICGRRCEYAWFTLLRASPLHPVHVASSRGHPSGRKEVPLVPKQPHGKTRKVKKKQ